MRKCIFVSVLLFFLFGCGADKPKFTKEELARIPLPQRTGLPEVSGGFTLAVGEETITSEEIIEPLTEHFRELAQSSSFEQFKSQARPQVEKMLTTKISNILLYQNAKRDAGGQIDEALEKAVEAEVRRFIVSFGGDYARAEEGLKEQGFADWAGFREYQEKNILGKYYVSSQLLVNRPITYSELIDCYNNMKEKSFVTPAMLKIQLIDIQPGKLEITDPNQSRQEQARRLANELIERLQGGADFAELALAYSHGHRRMFGGLWKPVQPQSLAEPYDILATGAEKIEPGQIAGPIEAGEHVFIMKLIEKRAKSVEPFEKVQREVEAKVDFDHRRRTVDEFGIKLTQQAAIGKRDEFIDFCVEKICQMSNK